MNASDLTAAQRTAERLIEAATWWNARSLKTNLPITVLVSHRLEQASGYWLLLGTELTRRPRPGRGKRVSGSKEPAPPAPGDVSVIDARHEIEVFAAEYAAVLVYSSAWSTGFLDGTLEQLAAMSERAGHFTEHPSEHLRLEFLADLRDVVDRAAHVFDRDLGRWNPIDVECFEPGCGGMLEVEIPFADDALSDAERQRAFKDSHPEARCSKDHTHVIDARLAHHAAFEGLR
ncbi:hypothetical protein RN607_00640 [Demequina capsici]|uniref:Uncharacterized protein n=1 Tax=Demequina capsici TaxID=3075620 RepID=A0AA96JAM9_9MICO|nr:hypothetical protein [Demequina sp. PMTSA13]WNM27540.1 hypothetical protein RN607_00640 [Demequina sp. PMTSA13]